MTDRDQGDRPGRPVRQRRARELADLGVPVLEDAAQAAGARLGGRRAGSLGDAATFSFFPSKNLPCLGDGGAIATDDDDVAEHARRLRFHGSRRQGHLPARGLQLAPRRAAGGGAAAAAAGARRLERGAPGVRPRPTRRRGSASTSRCRAAWTAPSTSTTSTSCATSEPDALAERLAARGIAARGYYRVPVHRQPAMKEFGAGASCPATTEAARTNLALPMGPELTRTQVAEVVDAVARLGRPDQQPARARHAPADRGDARGRARGRGHRPRLRADARAVRAPRHRAHGDRPPPRRRPGRQGARPRVALARAAALGAGARASTSRWATARTT